MPNNSVFIGFDFTQRAPNAVELFADGPHHALENVETGNLNLEKESSYNVTLGYNYNENLNKLKIEAYYNYINDFIAADRNGNTQNVEGEDFNVVIHDQYNALFTGVELSGQYGITKINDLDFLAKTYFYQEVPTDESGVIKKVQVDYSTAIKAPRAQRYTVVPQAVKDYNNDTATTVTAEVGTKQTLVSVSSAASLSTNTYIQINEEVMRIKEINGTNLLVARAQFGSKIAEHYAGVAISQVDAVDRDLIEVGDEFGFTESRSFFDSDGLEYSTVQGTDI